MSEETLRTCSSCGAHKPPTDFYAHPTGPGGRMRKCKECHKADVKVAYENANGRADYEKRREATPERKAQKLVAMRKHREQNPQKYKARTAVSNAVRDGRLLKLPCRVCGTTKRVQAHHHDYSKPLDVEWLCFEHHREDEHEQTIRTKEPTP